MIMPFVPHPFDPVSMFFAMLLQNSEYAAQPGTPRGPFMIETSWEVIELAVYGIPPVNGLCFTSNTTTGDGGIIHPLISEWAW